MISNDSNISHAWGSWLKWLISTAVALVAAGGSIVAILEYFNSPRIPDVSIPTAIMVAPTMLMPSSNDPQPIQTSTRPATETSVPQQPSPTDFVVSYWQNISEGRSESAWVQLSPEFRRDSHNNNYDDYARGYQQMNLCRVVVSNVNLMQQDSYFAVIAAHVTYYSGTQCSSSGYNFEMRLIYDSASNSWLFDKNIVK